MARHPALLAGDSGTCSPQTTSRCCLDLDEPHTLHPLLAHPALRKIILATSFIRNALTVLALGWGSQGHSQHTLFQLFLQVQLLAVSADGEVHPAEHDLIVRVARRLGLTDLDVARLEALLRAAARGAPGVASGPPPQQRLDDAYAAFGLSPEASVTEIKHAYRKLMLENHPDKLAAKGLPENMRAIAEERAREINAAYDLLKQARQFT